LLPVSLWLWAVSKPQLLPFALSSIFFLSLGLPRLIFLIQKLKATPDQSVSDLQNILRAASFTVRLEMFALGLTLMPLGSFLGLNFFVQMPLQASACAASLTFVVVLLMGRALEAQSVDSTSQLRLNRFESVIGVITIAALIVLGIYPTPLYNYIGFLTQHP
jgi:hypothetical protein